MYFHFYIKPFKYFYNMFENNFKDILFFTFLYSIVLSVLLTLHLTDKPTVPIKIPYTVVEKYEDNGKYYIIKSEDTNKVIMVDFNAYKNIELNTITYEIKREFTGINKSFHTLRNLLLILSVAIIFILFISLILE